MAPSIPNPNWPTLFAEGDFGSNPYYQAVNIVYTDMAPRLYKQWTVRRGKQFELDQVQPGEFHGQWVNTDGALDPSNITSYYSPGVLPYRGYRMRTQYPSSVNMLNGDAATGGEVTPLAVGTSGTASGVNGTNTFLVTASGSAYQGTQVWQWTGTTGVNANLFFLSPVPTIAVLGTSYTFSIRVRSLTTGANPVVYARMSWVSSTLNPVSVTNSSTVTLTGSPSATWTTITFSATVPGPSSGLYPVALEPLISLSGSVAGTWTFQVDGVQLEQSASASTFSIPGKPYPVFSGLIERYPQSWDFNGTYGLVQPVCVDTMALLSQTLMKEAFVMDMVATGPSWFFQLNDSPNTSTGAPLTFNEQAGRTPAAGVFSSSVGAGSLSAGTAITAANLVTGRFLGTQGPVVTVNNPTPNQGTVIDLVPAGITGPPTSGGWTRMIAFRTNASSSSPVLAAATTGYTPGSVGFNSNWYLDITGGATMNLGVSMYSDAGTHAGVTNGAVVNDNNWHLAFFSLSSDGKTLTLYVDGNGVGTTVGTDMHALNTANDSIGGDEYKNSGLVGYGTPSWQGDIALYAQWNFEMSSFTVTALYNSWRSAWQGDRSDQRYSRILSWAGFGGTPTLDTGSTTSMGPANDVNGLDALTCLQNVVNTEAGRHFVGVDGAVNFQSRTRLFQPGSPVGTPMWVFGENQGSGEIPYVDLTFDFDPTRISNAVAVTQTTTSQTYYANDVTSQGNYGTRNLSRTNQSTNSEEVRESAFFYLSRYKDPAMRVQLLRVDVAANPALWTSVLAFELGQYVKINRRDQFGVRPTISQFGFIEQITHTADEQGNWAVDLQVSPAPATSYATFTSLRTTLFSGASSGQPVITISPLPDSATNGVRSELTDGQVVFISGGGNGEFGTIAVGGVQNQAAGYASATVTLTGNLTHTYSAGASVVESTGANYDTFASFDNVQFAY